MCILREERRERLKGGEAGEEEEEKGMRQEGCEPQCRRLLYGKAFLKEGQGTAKRLRVCIRSAIQFIPVSHVTHSARRRDPLF